MTPQKIALLTDSCADLSPQLAAENQVFVVPLRILCADGEYRDGVDIRAGDIYRRLRAGELPQTSLPAAQDITDVGSGVSGRHALVRRDESGGWLVEDLGSKNGTALVSGATHEGAALEAGVPAPLRPGDELVLAGGTTFVAIEGVAG